MQDDIILKIGDEIKTRRKEKGITFCQFSFLQKNQKGVSIFDGNQSHSKGKPIQSYSQ
jgi:hypothetical protein